MMHFKIFLQVIKIEQILKVFREIIFGKVSYNLLISYFKKLLYMVSTFYYSIFSKVSKVHFYEKKITDCEIGINITADVIICKRA